MGSRTTAHLKPLKETKPKKGTGNKFGYDDIFFLREKPLTEAVAIRLAHEILEWSINNSKAFKIRQFCTEKRLSRHTFKDLRDRFPVLQRAVEEAKDIIGDRREIGALEGNLNVGMVMYKMPFYDKDWRDMAEWRASLQAKSQAAATQESKTVFVAIPKDEESDLVPEPQD